jgi:hypothetical protein
MVKTLTINVRNVSPIVQTFFFFQEPAVFVGGPAPQQIYANSLYCQTLTQGAALTFALLMQPYAGVQQQLSPPVVGAASGQLASGRAIGLTPAAGGPPTNNTTMTLSPSLGLSVPFSTTGPQPGNFRINAAYTFPYQYNAGSAVRMWAGGIVLSSFVTAQEGSIIDCMPTDKFYVQTGTYVSGTVLDFASASSTAALCDATSGSTSFDVVYNVDGTQPTWTVTPVAAGPANAEVRNEAGTAVVATGYASNFNAPVAVQNLSDTRYIHINSDYQVGPTGGPYVRYLCVTAAADTATFAGGD